ncbi:hypothetical protein OB2597_09129 [Pseudooceanicola batsensis HTCC2597]|uniref:histidine kinase n=1 Tax=Pseudooceanicola batsensis (strain ATCC BAA-863 / DSM 15984 / KCTC 12145 / HTCC2597) TaxID=252305 RepID=A3TUU8_PSEBH|nr:HWE histidine kinase domain-containing protein [Pseudooceanicola batsensis]EAQ04294.1 hypothetical protein OB2597_09129 [Pseudooceanicola batsensis HTCC2597]
MSAQNPAPEPTGLPPSHPTVDLTNCDREPIHKLGAVQSYGCLVVLSADWIVLHASANVKSFLGWEAADMPGRPLSEMLPHASLSKLRAKLSGLLHADATARLIDVDLFGDGRSFDASIHRSGRSIIAEFEFKTDAAPDRDDLGSVQALVHRIAAHGTFGEKLDQAVRGLKLLSGFDRVMVYRFAEDGAGEVVAEARERSMEPFLGLRYPASDIPQQARQLYTRNLLRLIADVDAVPSPLLPETDPTGEKPDLSLAVTRAVSPIHLEYLRNMGVGASMSVSLLRRGKLWGLMACHHMSPHYIDFEKRTAIELFAQLFSYELAQHEAEVERADMLRAQALHDKVIGRVSDGEALLDVFPEFAEEVETHIPHDGIAIYCGGEYRALGRAPTEDEFAGLARFLNTAPLSQVYSVQDIAAVHPPAAHFADRAVGMLALPISRTPRDYIVLFRGEVAQQVTWAGNPEKPVEATGPNGLRLTPRKSFEAWRQKVMGQSAPWTESEVRLAEALRTTLLEVVLKITDQANIESRRSREQQELLIAELNHRVRNILNLIRGLISQTRTDQDTVDSYISSLNGRIQSLARAHDQLTRQDWSAISLRELVEVEVRAFLTGAENRVTIAGSTPFLSPAAYSSMALVFHELVTNSVKYGALSDEGGHVAIDLARTPDGALQIHWEETGGPTVRAPTRRGFGSAIVERTIPHELQGTAQVAFRVTGLVADFTIPAKHVGGDAEPGDAAADPGGGEGLPDRPLHGHGLVVEDSMIIALDATDMMRDLGCDEVEVASSCSEALDLLESRQDHAAAIVDVNLGEETSAPVAARLSELGIPFLLATGYGETDSIRETFPGVPIVQKPYSTDALRAAFAAILSSKH